MRKLIKTGMNIARLNFSHGDFEEHGKRMQTNREIAKETKENIVCDSIRYKRTRSTVRGF